MKKILLLLVSGLLIACTAGSAMAFGVTFPNLPIIDGQRTMYIPADGSASSTQMNLAIDVAGDYTVSVSTDSNTLKARILNLNGITNTPWGSLTPVATDYDGLSAITYPCYLWVEGGTQGKVTIAVTGNDGNTADEQVYVSVRTRIPEFPTVALPVAAILGLVFIFGRRKEGL